MICENCQHLIKYDNRKFCIADYAYEVKQDFLVCENKEEKCTFEELANDILLRW